MKKIKFKRIFAFLLVIVASLLVGSISVNAETSGDYEYTVNSDGITCQITGYTGAGGDITIPASLNGYAVTSFAEYAFSGKTILTGVTIPNSVTSIAKGTFNNCTSLSCVTIPSSVTSILHYAFYQCESLTNITIPDSVTYLGNYVFWNCTSLISINMSSYISAIGEQTFWGCSNLIEVIIPSTVTSIGNEAFCGCSNLTNVAMPSGVTSIGSRAFYLCGKLTGAVIPSDVTHIGDYAFARCSSLTSITIPSGITTIGFGTFWGCTGLTNITISNSVTLIDNIAFNNCSSLTNITIPSSVTKINYRAFLNCSGLTNVYLDGESVTVDQYAFEGVSPAFYCPAGNSGGFPTVPVTEVSGNPITINLTGNGTITPSVTSGMPSETISLNIIPAKGYSLKPGSLKYNDGSNHIIDGTSFTMPSSSVTVSAEFERDTTAPTASLIFPSGTNIPISTSNILLAFSESVTSVSNKKVSISVGPNIYVYTITESDNYFGGTGSGYAINIPISKFLNGTEPLSLGYDASYTAAIDDGAYIDDAENPIAASSIGNFSTIKIYSYTANPDGVSCTIIGYGGMGGDITIPASLGGYTVTSFAEYAFADCSSLTGVTIPSSVTSIAKGAFANCSNLSNVTIESGATSIGHYAFDRCSSLTSITIPNSVKSIGNYAFKDCSNLNSINILNGVTSIGDSAFSYCSKLTVVILPSSVTSIANNAFIHCSGLNRVEISSGVTSIGDNTFSGCSGLTEISVDEANTHYSSLDGVLYNFDKTSLINYPAGLSGAFTIPSSVTSIGNKAFSNCSWLTGVTIPVSVTSIEHNAFSGCINLASVTIPSSITSIENTAFQYCTALSHAYFDGDMPTTGLSVFDNCSGSLEYNSPTGNPGGITLSPLTELETKPVTVNTTENGTISQSTVNGMPCETISLEITPATGYRLKPGSLKYNDGSDDYIISGTSFTMPDNAITISGVFAEIDNTLPIINLVSPSGTSIVLSASDIVLGFNETVTAVESKNVTISDGTNAYTYTIGASDGYVSGIGSDCKTTIPIQKFLNDTVPLSLGYNTTYTVTLEAGAYIDSADNETAASNIGSFKTEEEPDTAINIASIGGVTAPVRGATPVTSITETAQYTGTITWSPDDSTFAASTTYTATITLTPKAGYTLTGVAADFFTVSGATSVSNDINSGVITAVFPATEAEPDTAINIASIGGVTAPVRGATPVTSITETAQYTGTITWSPDDSTFAASTTYTATITLTPKAGYTLTGVAADFFTVSGATSVSNDINSGVITAVFLATEEEPDTAINIAVIDGVTAPVRGETPVTSITETAQYTGTVTWSPNSNPFTSSTTYTATITLTAKAGYTLTGVAADFFTVSGATSVSNDINSGVITAVFPATEEEPDTAINIASIDGVTAPVRGETPITLITETAQYTGIVTWSPNSNPFTSSTTYTATITLTPKAGYTLTGVAADFFTVSGATSVSNDINSGVITAVFPATEAEPAVPVTIISVAVKTAPTKITYTAGDILDLTGLVVTLHKSNSTTEDVAFADFATNGITTTPTNGTGLSISDTSVTIIYTADSKSVSQSITVNPAPVVNSATISPTGINYDLNAPADVVTTITWNSASKVTDVVYVTTSLTTPDAYVVTGSALTTPDAYVVTGSALTIKSSYINTLGISEGDVVIFKISFDKGNLATFTINVVNSYTPTANAKLNDLTVNGSLVSGFDPNTTIYNVELPYGTTSVLVGAVPDDAHAAVDITQAQILPGDATVVVTAEDKITTKSYTIHFTLGAAPTTYQVAVNGSYATASGTGSYYSGDIVTVNAGSRNNYTFSGWTSTDGITFANANSAITTFTMAAGNVTVTASWNYSGGSGGSSDGGGNVGGSGSTTDDSDSIEVKQETKPNQPTIGSISVKAKKGADNSASVKISEKTVASAIAKAQAAATEQKKPENGIGVSLSVSSPARTKSLGIILTQPVLTQLLKAEVSSFEIDGSLGTLNFDLKAIKEIQKQSTGDVTINITPVTGLNGDAKTLIGSRPVYNISISYVKDGKTMNIISLNNGSVILSISYTPGQNEATAYLFGVYVDGNGNATRIPESIYDANSGGIIFDSNHFSMYGVGYIVPSAKFTDISTHWARESIDYVVGRGLLAGTSETTFSPDTSMSRGMLVTALGRMDDADVSGYKTSSFTDVKADSTFLPYIEWAYKKGIISGIGNQQFAPDRAVTREEVSMILQNYAKATGYTLPITREVATFADSSSISSCFKDAVKDMQQTGIMSGKNNGYFEPKCSVTRAEVSTMLHRYIKLTIDPATAQGW